MNSILIYTRSYIDDEGNWDLNEDLICQMKELLEGTKLINWLVFCSNVKDPDKLKSKLPKRSILLTRPDKKSASEARYEILKYLLITSSPIGISYSYYMNIDSDDTLNDIDALIKFTEFDESPCDMIGFGINPTKSGVFDDMWDFNESTFHKYRRYITEQSQTMFAFLHNYKVVNWIMVNGLYFKPRPLIKISVLDDTEMAVDTARYNSIHAGNPFNIGAIASNFIKYKISDHQISRNIDPVEGKELINRLKVFGDNYVNKGEFYKVTKSGIKKFNPYE